MRQIVVLTIILLAGNALAVGEMAQPAAAFVDSIGVNTHYTNAPFEESPYSKLELDQKLGALGIHHIRDNTETPQGFSRIDSVHLRFDITAILVPNGTQIPIPILTGFLKQHRAYEAIEGLNEPDGRPRSFQGMTDMTKGATPNYPATRAFQDALYQAVKSDPATKATLVLSPAMAHVERQKYLDGVPFDIASMHTYPFGDEPTLALGHRIDQMKAMKTPDGQLRPIWITETGYYNHPTNGREASETAAGKYLPRLLALSFKAGIARTYIYELVDEGNDKSNREQNFGLLRFDLSEKPAYVALKNLIALLKEPVPQNTPPSSASLDFDLTTTDPSAKPEHLLLRKSDGRFYLLVWNEVPSWDRKTQKDIAVKPVKATLKFAHAIASARIYHLGEAMQMQARVMKVSSIDLDVGDELSGVEITP